MSFFARKPADSASAGPDAGSVDTSALTHLREHDYGPSLMDRAQHQRQALAGIGAGTQTLLLQAATSPLPHEAQLAALDRQSAQLADAERTQAGYRRLRERYDPDELDRSLQQVGAIADPVQQRESLTQLQASYAGFAFHPELARRIDAQFAEFEPVVQRREDAALRAAILAGRYAPTLADARQLYPGRKINTLMAPGSNVPVFVPERFADPDLEAEAVQVIQNAYHLAKVTGRRSHLEAALDDEAVRQVSRIPGNRASVVFGQVLAALSTPPSASTTYAGEYSLGSDYKVLHRPPHSSAPAATESPPASVQARPETQSAESGPATVGPSQSVSQASGRTVPSEPFQLPMTRAEARRRYGEIVPARDRVGPPLPLTAKNVAAVAADAALKTVVGLATIGNFADQPRGNLNEIGVGFGALRTAAGDAIGVDVDNPRFGLASDLLPLPTIALGKGRGGRIKPPGDMPTISRVGREPLAPEWPRVNRQPYDTRIRLTPENEPGGISGRPPHDGRVRRVGTNSHEVTEVPLDEIKPIHPVPRSGKPDGYIESLASGILADGFDVGEAVNIVKMPNGIKVSFGGHHRIAAMKELKQSTIPAKVVNWVDFNARTQQRWLRDFPTIAEYLK